MYRIKGSYVVGILMFYLVLAGCQNQVEHTAPAIRPQDSVAMMTSYGVNTLVSDSGVMKYRIVTERWEVNTSKNPSLWIFDKGLLLEQFDEKFHINSYIQCDTAYYYDQQKIWKLYGRVSILTKMVCVSIVSNLPGIRISTNCQVTYSVNLLLLKERFRVLISGVMKR